MYMIMTSVSHIKSSKQWASSISTSHNFYIDVVREYDTLVEVIIPQLPTSFKGITDADGKSALIWILGEYGEVLVCI